MTQNQIALAVALALVRAAQSSWMIAARALSDLDDAVPEARSVEPALAAVERSLLSRTIKSTKPTR